MAPPSDEFSTLHWSTDQVPERDRVAFWREELGRSVIRLDIEPLPDLPFFGDVTLRAWHGLKIGVGSFSGVREQRTHELTADGNDDFSLLVSLTGRFTASQRGRDFTVDHGDAFFASQAEPASYLRPSLGRVLGAIIPRAAIAQLVPDVDDAVAQLIPRDNAALELLTSYLGAVADIDASTAPELRQAVATHICDLVALTIGATRDAVVLAEGRGVRAARLRAIKADIAEHLGRPDLSVATIAARHRMTPRHVHRLFEVEGTTFSEFVLGQRLLRAHAMLTDPRYAGWTIGAIADESGFGDRSYFNRAIRRAYGASPSDLRAGAKRE
jgi:AraC-like DNA-binding protein